VPGRGHRWRPGFRPLLAVSYAAPRGGRRLLVTMPGHHCHPTPRSRRWPPPRHTTSRYASAPLAAMKSPALWGKPPGRASGQGGAAWRGRAAQCPCGVAAGMPGGRRVCSRQAVRHRARWPDRRGRRSLRRWRTSLIGRRQRGDQSRNDGADLGLDARQPQQDPVVIGTE
jgi:hypothetical protein